ncbi:MAG TPA: hypothetical protein VMC09_18565 [Anaerolineales bacterium]|nr:hypothetical protein [Anaerolineales bacterium]
MANIRCPMCGKPNPPEVEECKYCGARIKPMLSPKQPDPNSIKPGEKPIKRDTSEFEKVKLADQGTIRPGDAPTKKNTAELEQALPSWLRTLREDKSAATDGNNALEEPAADAPEPAAPASPGDLPDWLSGLEDAKSVEDEEVPDWLAGLRGEKPVPATPSAPESKGEDLSASDWSARLGNLSGPAAPEPSPAFDAPAESSPATGEPDWLQSLQPAGSVAEPPASAPSAPVPAPSSPSAGEDNLPAWLSGLPAISPDNKPPFETPAEPTPESQSSGPEWLNELKKKAEATEPPLPAAGGENVPDWLTNVGSAPGTPSSSTGESVPEWLSNLEAKSGPGAGTTPALVNTGSLPADSPAGDKPDWLSQMKADVNAAEEVEKHKDDFEVVSEPAAPASGTGPLPDWLSGIQRDAPSSSGGDVPALITDNNGNPPGEQPDTAFSMDAPDWLSKLKPDQNADKPVENDEEAPAVDNIDASELPSWVQAMRPVEAVVSKATTTPQEENQVAEQSGPLAGLRGVLPAGPGLGPLRKPPAYTTKLQVSDAQQRYASFLERLVAGESETRRVESKRLTSSRLWRWLITAVLFLSVGLPLAFQINVVPAAPAPSDAVSAAADQFSHLDSSLPVLVAFDYDPALSGELEATAAPIFDLLLSKTVPLAVISTSPTGPALADDFLSGNTPLVMDYKYVSGQQYINLGYLAGGPAGISAFAMEPKNTMLYNGGSSQAWSAPSLQNVQHLSDFAAVIVLTDNADTGRNWVEQTKSYLAGRPLIMIISAQAEPMIRPYFDSGQLKGMISGLADAKAFEQSYTRPGPAQYYWNSFGIGLLISVLLIGLGSLWSIFAGWRARRDKSGGEV